FSGDDYSTVLDVLGELADASLITTTTDPATASVRFSMLDTVTEFGHELLRRTPHDAEAARAAHMRYYVDMLNAACRGLPLMSILNVSRARVMALEQNNLLAATEHAAQTSADALAELAVLAGQWFRNVGLGLQWTPWLRAVEANRHAGHRAVEALVLEAKVRAHGDVPASDALLERAWNLAGEQTDATRRAWVTANRAFNAVLGGDQGLACRLAEDALQDWEQADLGEWQAMTGE